jgi:Domain of unknown function (DUF4386)
MNGTKKAARVAGLWYLLMAITAPIGLLYVPSRLIVSGDAAATASRIRESELLFRIGIASELFHQTIAIFLVLALYRLFRPVDEARARQLVILGALVSVPIAFLNVLNEIAALVLIGGSSFLSVFDRQQLDALAYLFIRLHAQGINVVSIFWGLWLFPFGMLVIRSRFIPRVLGMLLFLAGGGYLAFAAVSVVAPHYAHVVGSVAMILEVGELPIIGWLAIWGARAQPVRVAEIASSGASSMSE